MASSKNSRKASPEIQGPMPMPYAWSRGDGMGGRLSPQQIMNMWNSRTDADITALFGNSDPFGMPYYNKELAAYLMSGGQQRIPAAVNRSGVTIPQAQVQQMMNDMTDMDMYQLYGMEGYMDNPTMNFGLADYYDNLPALLSGYQQ